MPGERSRKADRKATITGAARKVFATYGFDAGTIRQIAAEAGVAEGLIYHYFDSKEALLDAIIQERSILPWLAEPEALSEALPVEAALREFAAEGIARMARNADVFAVVWSQMATNPRLAERVGRIVREVTDGLAGYLDRKIARGELRPVDTTVAARIVAGSMVLFTLSQYRLAPPLRHLSPDDYADGLIDLLMNGLAPRTAGTKHREPTGDRGGDGIE